jgi:hypothetical protein
MKSGPLGDLTKAAAMAPMGLSVPQQHGDWYTAMNGTKSPPPIPGTLLTSSFSHPAVADCYADDMATTSPARIDDELYASAKLAGSVQSRSASQQVAHWARIGREIEASSSISPKDISAVLAGSRSYDSLDAKEQAVVRAAWSARMDELRSDLDLAERFTASGRSWVELDDKGRVVERRGAAKAPAKKPAAKNATVKKAATPTKKTKKTKVSTGGTKRAKVRAAG